MTGSDTGLSHVPWVVAVTCVCLSTPGGAAHSAMSLRRCPGLSSAKADCGRRPRLGCSTVGGFALQGVRLALTLGPQASWCGPSLGCSPRTQPVGSAALEGWELTDTSGNQATADFHSQQAHATCAASPGNDAASHVTIRRRAPEAWCAKDLGTRS